MPLPTYTIEEREVFWAALVAELPAFSWFLKQWQIPPELACSRFGIASFQHPELVAAIEGCSPESQLLSLIDTVLFTAAKGKTGMAPTEAWQGTAGDLHHLLVESDHGYEAKQLLRWPNATGAYLGRLQEKSRRVERTRTSQSRLWIITPPRRE